jgi:DNA topoisomerase IA
LPAAKLSVDVKNNFAPKYALIKGKEKLVKELKDKVEASDAVYLAADPDREGEAISWHLATVLGLDLSKENRVTFNEITKTGVKNGMAAPRKVDIDLVNAQQARRILDRLVGYKLSPFVSQKIRRGLSAGRVQSVAVRMIVDRENEIRAFNPEEYWSLEAKFQLPDRKVFTAEFYGDETGKVELKSQEQTDSYIKRLKKVDTAAHIDCVLCQLSTNDATLKLPLGETGDGTAPESFDTSTVTGAMEYIIAYSRESWGCPVVFYTGSYYDSKEYSAMVGRLPELRDKWGIGVIDLYNDKEFNNISEDAYKHYMADPIHPTKEGYAEWWMPKLESEMIRIMQVQ